MILILTGNYAYFNFLTIALCLTLFEWGEMVIAPLWQQRLAIALAIVIVPLSVLEAASRMGVDFGGPVIQAFSPFHIANSYGLFAAMTTERPEIIIEGSDDGKTWKTYEFSYKPGDLHRRPPFVAPHQPRLDWQMWFAALGGARDSRWFSQLMLRLLQGSPDVARLFAYNPFPNHPPRTVRATLYEYRFTTPEEKRQTGDWWARELKGMYFPEVSLPKQGQ